MAGLAAGIINKYQELAPQQVVKAVQKAAEKTGADFSFLMEKAAAESSFNPKAKAKTSSATGLFQFIESTWLSMLKEHGAKYGLGAYTKHIQIKDGKPCLTCDGATKKAILDLRKNPEIAALMAGEFSTENKRHLEKNTRSEIGNTELYLAHFLGAGSAAKFINSRDVNGNVIGAEIFPAAARANKSVFFDPATGKPRTLDQIHDYFSGKFTTGGTNPPSLKTASLPHSLAVTGSTEAPLSPALTPHEMTEALPLFDDANDLDDIIWNDDPRFHMPSLSPRLSLETIIWFSEA